MVNVAVVIATAVNGQRQREVLGLHCGASEDSALVATIFRSIFEQPSAEGVWAQHTRVVAQLEPRFPDDARVLADATHEILTFVVEG